jgi:hypothetical protein
MLSASTQQKSWAGFSVIELLVVAAVVVLRRRTSCRAPTACGAASS